MTSLRTLLIPAILLAATAAAVRADTTYSKEISRLYRAKCEMCHRDGDIAPFSLNSYDAAMTWSDDIRRVLRIGQGIHQHRHLTPFHFRKDWNPMYLLRRTPMNRVRSASPQLRCP